MKWSTLGVIILLGNYPTFLQIYMGISMYDYEVKGKIDFCNEKIYNFCSGVFKQNIEIA